jgi:hypothetical protein
MAAAQFRSKRRRRQPGMDKLADSGSPPGNLAFSNGDFPARWLKNTRQVDARSFHISR